MDHLRNDGGVQSFGRIGRALAALVRPAGTVCDLDVGRT
jgi:hypothetical protein